MKAEPNKRQVWLAFGAAAAFTLAALINVFQLVAFGERSHFIGGALFAAAGLMWTVVAFRWRKRIA
jgi:hypothetical protein